MAKQSDRKSTYMGSNKGFKDALDEAGDIGPKKKKVPKSDLLKSEFHYDKLGT